MSSEVKPFKIRDVEINPPLILSPMAGVTDVSFRRLLKRRGGVGLSVSEFISVEGLTRSNPKSKRQMRFYQDERPFAVHVTLARRIAAVVRRPLVPPLVWHVAAFALVASELDATGARYRVLSSWPLTQRSHDDREVGQK